ncbi:hypothetical protein CI109_102003 [Kwoniella shandongensis]|uniref:Uncharacterized protein n=1 Tax=Kwoniella shandongensis TaxID=1734106 RepID=A0A5M6BSV4_9TREE|nr:uncharacterized protein CI109_006562 [Kwoniella shandongensis]KAA5525100.1 hypothetical protein CI109_006562 [Kwoniella shandongensis]
MRIPGRHNPNSGVERNEISTITDTDIEQGHEVDQSHSSENEKDVRTIQSVKEKEKEGHHHHGQFEDAEIPDNNLAIVMPALGLIAFVSALDQSIVATALPTIAQQFNTTPSQYSWIGTSYLLAQVIMNPVTGRLTDIIGRKPALYAAVVILLIFSAMCGAAKNGPWLIVSRALAGVGGGSVVSLTLIVTSDIVPLNKRGLYQGWMAASWGVAGTLGPILGGLLTEKASWRWCFYINIPICAVVLVLLFFFLNLKQAPRGDIASLRKSYDFLGLVLIMTGAALIIVGFSTAADDGFSSPRAYGVIIGGIVTMILAVVHFLTTKRNAIVPARMLTTRTPLFFMFGSFFQSLMFMPAQFLLPQFFQGVGGASSLRSGIDLIPFSVTLAVAGIIAGQITAKFHIVRPIIWVGFAMAAIGYGLWYACYTSTVSYATQEGLQVFSAFGIGLSISTPMLVIQASMPGKDMAAATAAWVLVRSMGASIGVAVFTAIFNTGLRSKFRAIEGFGTAFNVPTGSEGYRELHSLPDGPMKVQVLAAFADAMRLCWIIGCGFLCFALALTFFTKSYSLERAYGNSSSSADGDEVESPTDEEKKLGDGLDAKSSSREGVDQDDVGRAMREDLLLEDGLRDTGGSVPPTRTHSRVH